MSTQHPTAPHPTAQHRPARLAFAAAAALGLAALSLSAASPALAHDQLVGTELVAGDDGATSAVRLSYSNSIIEVGTEILVTDADGADATAGDPEVSGPDVTQPLADDLADGAYDVAWRVVSSDGHPIEGGFVFTVTDGAGEIVEDAADAAENHEPADEAEHEHAADEHDQAEEAAVPVWGVVGVVVAGVVVIGGALAAITVGQRRRRAGMGLDGDAPEAPRDEA